MCKKGEREGGWREERKRARERERKGEWEHRFMHVCTSHCIHPPHTHLSNYKVCVKHNRVSFLDGLQRGRACPIPPSLWALLLGSGINSLPAIKPSWEVGTS